MKIAIDIQTAVGRPTGVGRHVTTLVRELARLPGDERYRLFCFDFRRRFGGLGIGDPRFDLRRLRLLPGALYTFLSERAGRPDFALLAGRCDLYHFPNFIIHPLRRGAAVVTVHDLSFARFPEYADPRNLARLSRRFRYTLDRADAVITVSAFSKAELMALYGVPEERITVIHNGIPGEAPAGPAPIDPGYFLFVGTIEPRKNFGTLLDAWRIVRDRGGEAARRRLVVAGGAGWRCPPAREQLRSRGLEGAVDVLDYVPQAELPALYAGAAALVFPSFYEGFGLPPLEAMRLGVPVIASAIPAVEEVAGDAAVLCDPRDPEAFAGAMERLCADEGLGRGLAARGIERARLFTGGRMARETLALYRKLLR
ncbi:MAG: glycosyltransferase family 1 protein [bacterium]|nr:glycosyltransferase family 1 protein [bacterium]